MLAKYILSFAREAPTLNNSLNALKYCRATQRLPCEQVIDLPSPLVAVVCEVLQAGLPEGVQLCLDHHQPHHKEVLYSYI